MEERFSFLRNVGISPQEITKQDQDLKRKRLYWVCQFAGWFLFSFASIVVNSTVEGTEGVSWENVEIWILLALTGILFTHIYRGLIHKWNWLKLPLHKIIPRVLFSSVAIGTLMFAVLLLYYFIIGGTALEELKITTPLMGIINLSSTILVWSLIYFSAYYFENYKRAEIESYIWEAAVKDFELKTLKSQLNPHFMFNALNSIRALIKEDPQSAQNAVTKLSGILRYSLKMEETETVPFQDEMKTVSDYLSLEKMRFEERLKYEINNSPETLNVEIPPMMIQTLVENGIKHGISKRTSGGEISICSNIIDSKLHIKIKNTGSINPDFLKNAKGFGINNTKHRLNLLYGEKASFTIKNELQNEVLTELIIPIGGIKNESFNYRR